MPRALVLTYHAVGEGQAPLFVAEELFRAHVEALERVGARTHTVSELTAGLEEGKLPDRSVAITFDDGEAGAVRYAIPLLLERGMAATVFCVAGHLGGASDWPSYPPQAPRLRLAAGGELRELAEAGIEIGCHGHAHEPLDVISPEAAPREVVESGNTLAQVVGKPVCTFAWPYGARPNGVAARLIEESYTAACSTVIDRVDSQSSIHELPRVDAHYLRRPELLRQVVAGRGDLYLRLRALGNSVRRAARADYGSVETGS